MDPHSNFVRKRASRTVSFDRPFRLTGMDSAHAPGTFRVVVEQIELDVPWAASRTSMSILLNYGAHIESWPVSADELDALVAADRASAMNTGYS